MLMKQAKYICDLKMERKENGEQGEETEWLPTRPGFMEGTKTHLQSKLGSKLGR